MKNDLKNDASFKRIALVATFVFCFAYGFLPQPALAQAVMPTDSLAAFEGHAQSGKRFRWLAQSVSTGGVHGKDCEKNRLALPLVSYEDTGARLYKNANGSEGSSYYPPSFQKILNDPKQLTASSNDLRILALRHAYPKLQGRVYGFDSDGKRTVELILNVDLVNIAIHAEGACVQAQHHTGTAADRAEGARYLRYAKAVQALYQNNAVTVVGGATTLDALMKTVIFTNDPNDVPHIPEAQVAPADIAAKLNARLKAKLARDLERQSRHLKKQLDDLATPAGLAQIANRSLDGKPPTKAQNESELSHRQKLYQLEMEAMPANIDLVFVPCAALQYDLDAAGGRKLYELRCGKGDTQDRPFGLYEQTEAGELVLVKTSDTRTNKQRQEGMPVHPFTTGIAKFNLGAWTSPYASAWRSRWIDLQTLNTKLKTANPYADNYVKGTVVGGQDDGLYFSLLGVYDLLPMRAAPLTQLYTSETGHHESPFEIVAYEPGAKPGDAWTVRRQTWPVMWLE